MLYYKENQAYTVDKDTAGYWLSYKGTFVQLVHTWSSVSEIQELVLLKINNNPYSKDLLRQTILIPDNLKDQDWDFLYQKLIRKFFMGSFGWKVWKE